MSVRFHSDGIVHVGGVELADDDLSEKQSEIFPAHIEGAIVRTLVVIVLVAESRGPSVGLEGPLTLPNCLAPGVTKLNQCLSLN